MSKPVQQRTLAIVPARGGSQGIPRKNIRRLGGYPLLAYTLVAAEAAGIERVILSTEDEEIAEVGRRLGFQVPFLRPQELAGPEVATVPVLLDVLAQLRAAAHRDQGDAGGGAVDAVDLDEIDTVCLLQPTSPFRTPRDIIDCLSQLHSTDAGAPDAAVTVREVPLEYHPQWVYRRGEDGAITLFGGEAEPIGRRQDLAPAWHRDGSVYAVRLATLEKERSLYGTKTAGVAVSNPHWVNLDTLEDWREAELLVEAHPSLVDAVRSRYRSLRF